MTVQAVARDELLQQAAPVVRAILMRKSGMSLAVDDARADNVDAIDLYQDILARLWERLLEATGEAPDVRDFKGYAAQVAYNAWSDHLREKYPRRASLKNRLRYFLGHQSAYAIWENAENELVAGLRKWQFGAPPAAGERVTALRTKRERLASGAVPAKAMERFDAADWQRLLDALFARLGGPTSLDDLVGAVADLIGLREDRVESLDEDAQDDSPLDELADAAPRPDQRVELRQQLVRLWAGVLALEPEYRCAYLLNIPGPGKSRGDIEVFAMQGIASVAVIGATLGLTRQQYGLLWTAIDLEQDDRDELAQLETTEECFCLLWKYLPLADALIGRVLGLEQQQVINRRMFAMRKLASALAEPVGRERSRGPEMSEPVFRRSGSRRL